MNDVISVFSLAINGATIIRSSSNAIMYILNIVWNSLLSLFISSQTRIAEINQSINQKVNLYSASSIKNSQTRHLHISTLKQPCLKSTLELFPRNVTASQHLTSCYPVVGSPWSISLALIFAARCYASAAYAVMQCLSLSLCVCHVREFC